MAFRPFTYTTPQYGQEDYLRAEKKYDIYASKYSDLITETLPDVREGITAAKGLQDYYQPGGGYGGGLRQEAKETVQGGLAKSLGYSVASGMSSQFGARGVSVLAGAELSKLYKNIEDTRAQLLTQAFAPYAQMIQTLGQLAGTGAQLASAAPKRGQYVTSGRAYISGYGPTLT